MTKRALTLLLALIMVFTLIPMAASADSDLDPYTTAISAEDGSYIEVSFSIHVPGAYSLERKAANGSYSVIKTGTANASSVDGIIYNDSNVSLSTVYYYRVKDANGVYSNVSACKRMAAPTDVKVKQSGNNVTVTWGDGKYCDAYLVQDIYVSLSDPDCAYTDTYITDAHSYTFKNRTSGFDHVFCVWAVDSTYGCLGYPVEPGDEDVITIVSAPKLLDVSLTGRDYARLEWDQDPWADSYVIYRGSSPDNLHRYSAVAGDKTTYINTAVSYGEAYYYAVSSVYGSVESPRSNVKVIAKLSNPKNFNATSYNGEITLRWTASSGAAKYWVYRSTDGGKNYSYYTTVNTTHYTNTAVTPGNAYYYKIKAVKTVDGQDFTSPFSAIAFAYVTGTPNISLSNSNGRVTISWDAVKGANKYWVFRSTDGKNFVHYGTTTGTSYVNSSITPGVKYYYAVKAVHSGDMCDAISRQSDVKSTMVLTAPQVSASCVNGAAKLSWNAVSGASKYFVYRSTDGVNFSYYSPVTKNTYTNSSVTAGTTYYYKVRAVATVDGVNWYSQQSPAVSVTIKK